MTLNAAIRHALLALVLAPIAHAAGQDAPVAMLARTPPGNPAQPPFALLDQFGVVQRYVEPSPGINLASYVGRRVRVLHDTGDTLLASQLDLQFDSPMVLTADHEVEELPPAGGSIEPIPSESVDVEPIMLDELPPPGSVAPPCADCQLHVPSTSALPTAPCTNCGRRRCSGCQPPPVSTPRFQFATELLFMKYYRADGVRAGYVNAGTGLPEDIDFDHEFSPRLVLAYGGSGELGFRLRYWEFDHTAGPVHGGSSSQLGVDAYTLDLELFERRRLSPGWTLELAGGLRYVDFEESMVDASTVLGPTGRINIVDGWAGSIGAELTRSLGTRGNLYARTRFAILQDDHSVAYGTPSGTVPPFTPNSAVLIDTTHTISELAFGYEFRTCTNRGSVFFARAGYEWQHWDNFSTSFSPVASPIAVTPNLAGPSDVGFGGFALAIGLER